MAHTNRTGRVHSGKRVVMTRLHLVFIGLGVLSAATPVLLVATGVLVRRIRFADETIWACLALAAVCGFALFSLDNAVFASSGQSLATGLLFTESWAGSVVFLIPFASLVARLRRRKGWSPRLSGVPPETGKRAPRTQ